MSEDKIERSPTPRNPDEIPRVSIFEFMYNNMKESLSTSANTVWVGDVLKGTSIKFSEVEPMSRKLASALWKRGFGKGQILYFVAYDAADIFLVLLACWRCNGAVRGCYQKEEVEEFTRQMKETKTRFVLCDSETENTIKAALKNLEWEVQLFSIGEVDGATSVQELLKDDGKAYPENLDINPVDDIIIIINTSGSTGTPKGAMHTHFSAIAALCSCNFTSPNTTFLTLSGNYLGSSFICFACGLSACTSVYFVSKYKQEEYLSIIDKIKPNVLFLYPYVATWFARAPELKHTDLSFLQTVVCAGSVLDTITVNLLTSEIPSIKLIQAYAMSECLTLSTTALSNSKPLKNDEMQLTETEDKMYTSSGKLLPFVQAKVIDISSGEILSRNQQGEILIKAPHIMKGYLNNENATAKAIDADGWVHTGDKGYFDEEGHLFIVERVAQIFKYFMHQICPSELESLLQEHPAVLGAGVVGVPDPTCTNLARAYVLKKPGKEVTAEELQKYIEERAVSYKHLRGGVVFVNSLPQNRGGKLDRPALQKMALN